MKHIGIPTKAELLTVIFLLTLFCLPISVHTAAGSQLEVNVSTSQGRILAGVKTYAFSEAGAYYGLSATTDSNGNAAYDAQGFGEGSYKFRIDYLGYQFWTDPLPLPGNSSVSIVIDEATVEVSLDPGLEGVRVYLFTETGAYQGVFQSSDAAGKAAFALPAGKNYKFRADHLGSQYWSDVVAATPGELNNFPLVMDGGLLQILVQKETDSPMAGIKTYLFNQSGSYLGQSGTTDANGLAQYEVTGGNYRIRVDYLGYQFWSEVYSVPATLAGTLALTHRDSTVTVNGMYQGTPAVLAGIKVYLFTPAGSYLGQNRTTDANGQVIFNLPDMEYKVRADYLGQKFWSDMFVSQDISIDIPMADTAVTVTGSGLPLSGVPVFVFTAGGSYLGLNQTTDTDGQATFRLPAGVYKFRTDFQGSQYWSTEETLIADQANPITVSTGGGTFAFTVLKGLSDPLADVQCYVFSEAGDYLGLNGVTDANGQVSFNLADGSYKIRVDYLGYQFWSEIYNVPTILSGTLSLPHQNTIITVTGWYQETAEPMPGVPVYLFPQSGSYLGKSQTTDAAGQAVFNLPDMEYKVRADYLGQQFWSDIFLSTDTSISINQGLAEIHLHNGAVDIAGAAVYLFSEAGSYLGRSGTTDATGRISFLLPDRIFKLRADANGDQHWSPLVTITPHMINTVDMNIFPITVTLSADPATIQTGETATLTWTSTGADTCTIEPAIGAVGLSGSITVSPTQTTTYTITTTGPEGAAASQTTITVINSVPTVSLSVDRDTVMIGDSASLTWSTSGADSIEIDQGVGPVGSSGAISVSPDITTTYTITATGSGGTTSASITITIIRPEFPSLKIVKNDPNPVNYWDDLWFGASVAVSDGYAVIGAPLTDFYSQLLIEDAGAAYIYRRQSSTWVEEAKLQPSDPSEWGYFGSSVSISNDTVIVGASYATVNGLDAAGAAYIFRKINGIWIEEAKLTASNPEADEYFGYAVSISGDHAIVGVDTNNNNIYTPKVYIFKYDGAGWNLAAELSPSDPESYWHFGNAVSISGNYAVVGAPYNVIQRDRGSVYVYHYNGTAWIEETILMANDAESRDNFGHSVSINNDYIIVGAINKEVESSGSTEPPEPDGGEAGGDSIWFYKAGAAYIFKQEASGWTEQARLVASDVADWLQFGLSVAVNGTYAVVGAANNSNNSSPYSSNYVFKRFGTEWREQNVLYAGIATEYDEFGPNVALGNDFIVIGDYDDYPYSGGAGSSHHPGAAYFYDMPRVFANISADPAIDPNGESVLTWSSGNAADCVLAPDIGSVPCSGTMPITVNATTTFTLTATGPLGSAVAGATVAVGYPSPELSASATPNTIQPGTTAEISWTTTVYTDSVTIDNGVGVMPVNGSVTVTPAATTTYTITATGPGGTTTAAVTITVLPPTVTLTAAPEIISLGDSSILAWSSTGGDSVTITGIGPVPLNGSYTVSPTNSTTYVVTVTGPSGSSSAGVTVTVLPPPPTISSFKASPPAVMSGESTTLSWEVLGADEVFFGYVQGSTVAETGATATGSITENPTATATYQIRAVNAGGERLERITVEVLHPLEFGIIIASPLNGDSIIEPYVLVRGIVNSPGGEVGVTVNGMPAQVNGNNFFVNNVPLAEGENTITATATEPDGSTVSDSVTVFCDPSGLTDWIELSINLESGIAPLNATLRADLHLSFIPVSHSMGYTGPGTMTIVEEKSETEIFLSFDMPGIYTVYYYVTDSQNTEYEQKIMVNVLNAAALDALLKAKWNGMKGALNNQDIEEGLTFFLDSTKEKYRGAFNAIASELPQLAADMQDIEMIYMIDSTAKYRINRLHDIAGTPVIITYYIYFGIDKDGLWGINQF